MDFQIMKIEFCWRLIFEILIIHEPSLDPGPGHVRSHTKYLYRSRLSDIIEFFKYKYSPKPLSVKRKIRILEKKLRGESKKVWLETSCAKFYFFVQLSSIFFGFFFLGSPMVQKNPRNFFLSRNIMYRKAKMCVYTITIKF